MRTNVSAYIDNLIEYGEFKLEFTLEGTKFKIPKIKAKIIDKTIPKNVEINVVSEYGFCYYKGYHIDIEFNNASYTSIIEYDIKSSYINITTYKDIEKYEYNIKQVERKADMIPEEISVENYIKQHKCVNWKINDTKKVQVEVPAKNENESKIIESINFCTFCKKCEEGYFLSDDECLKKCEIGENEKCNSCNPQYPQFCHSCNEKYYLPSKSNTICKKCEIDNCLECMGNNSYTQCIKCENNYILSGGICLKNCEIGENNKCLKCNEEPGKINQCSLCNNGFYLPEYNKTQCEKCLLNGCMTCSGNSIENICIKCENNLSAIYENGTIISCIKEKPYTPDRIDIIKNGKLIDGIIEIKPDYVTKTQLSDEIKYFTSATCIANPSSYWWKTFTGSPGCTLPIYYNISEILPEGQNKLDGEYQLYLYATEKFTGKSNSPYNEFGVHPYFYIICDSENFGNKYLGLTYCSNTFGVYRQLENRDNNGRIMLGGIYTRGSDFYQLEGFNYTTTIANGTDKIGWNFYIDAGDFGQVTGQITISFIIKDLYLIKKPK